MYIAIVDDDKVWREKTFQIVRERYGEKAIIKTYSSGVEFNIANTRYDIVLMDIDMPQQDGVITIADYHRVFQQTIIVMMTDGTELEEKKYYVDPFRYILKDTMKEDLNEMFDAAERVLEMNQAVTLDAVNKGILNVKIRDILYIDISKRNMRVHTEGQDYNCRDGIGYLEHVLEKCAFFQSHKFYIVNLDKVKHFDRKYIYFADGSQVSLHTSKYQELKDKYMARLVSVASM